MVNKLEKLFGLNLISSAMEHTQKNYYRVCLSNMLEDRIRINPQYSLRRFARALQVDHANLSAILSGRRNLSIKTASKIMQRLTLSHLEKSKFIDSVIRERSLNGENVTIPEDVLEIDNDIFNIIGDWHHYAILQLCRVVGFKSEIKWISAQLSINEMNAKLAIDRLLKVGLLKREKGQWVRVNKQLDTKDKSKTSPALRNMQKQVLQKAIEAMDEVPIEERVAQSMSMAIDPDKIALARKMIQEFVQQLTEALESGKKVRVYNLHVNLYPIQKQKKEVVK